ncbi:MAG: copper homeostasis protein CutC [Bacteroidales bacterium]|nr:copper homeostasis protein CutC [Bacteroidales bacterium]
MKDNGRFNIERCCTNAAQAIEALKAGAARIELCRDIAVGGLTPSDDEILRAAASGIAVNVLVRPRAGDFVYSATELGKMADSIRFCRKAGVNGIATGVLRRDGSIDVDAMEFLMKESEGLSVTFHRAFDECHEPFEALEDIISLGCDRILTSGQAESAYEGMELIAELVRRAAGRISIMPGAGITPENLPAIAAETGASEFHGTRLALH